MVKISELSNGAGIGGTEQVPVNDSGTTVKYTVDAILARQHDHTASDITDFDTEVSNNTTVTTLVTDLNTAEGTIATHTTDIGTLNTNKLGKTELRTGLTANKALVTDGSGNEGYTDSPSVVKLAGENITAGNVIRPAFNGAGGNINANGGTAGISYRIGYDNTEFGFGNSFTVITLGILTNIQILNAEKIGTPTGNLTMYIYNMSNVLVATSGTVAESGLSGGVADFTFNDVIFPGQYYYLITVNRAVSTTNYSRIWGNTTVGYTGGNAIRFSNTLAQTAFGTQDVRFVCIIGAISETAGRVYKADATKFFASLFCAFAKNTATTGNDVTIDFTYNDQQTGLTIGSTYYLSNTPGAISTTPGTISKVVGKSISTTELLINLFG